MDKVNGERTFFPALSAQWNDPLKHNIFSYIHEGIVYSQLRGEVLRSGKAWTALDVSKLLYADSFGLELQIQTKVFELIQEGVLTVHCLDGSVKYTLTDEYYSTYVGTVGQIENQKEGGHGDCDDTCPFISQSMDLELSETCSADGIPLRSSRTPSPVSALIGKKLSFTDTEDGMSFVGKRSEAIPVPTIHAFGSDGDMIDGSPRYEAKNNPFLGKNVQINDEDNF